MYKLCAVLFLLMVTACSVKYIEPTHTNTASLDVNHSAPRTSWTSVYVKPIKNCLAETSQEVTTVGKSLDIWKTVDSKKLEADKEVQLSVESSAFFPYSYDSKIKYRCWHTIIFTPKAGASYYIDQSVNSNGACKLEFFDKSTGSAPAEAKVEYLTQVCASH